jgi:hypothetical protein
LYLSLTHSFIFLIPFMLLPISSHLLSFFRPHWLKCPRCYNNDHRVCAQGMRVSVLILIPICI